MSEFKQDDTRKFVFEIQTMEGRRYISMKLWQREGPLNEFEPTLHSLLIPLEFANELRKAIDQLFSELMFNPK